MRSGYIGGQGHLQRISDTIDSTVHVQQPTRLRRCWASHRNSASAGRLEEGAQSDSDVLHGTPTGYGENATPCGSKLSGATLSVMSEEIVIHVPQRPLPGAILESADYQELSVGAREAFLGHVRYIQELPFKFDEWLAAGANASELEALIRRVDLDLMIHLAAPSTPSDAVSPWLLRTSWAWSGKPLRSFLGSEDIAELNRAMPTVGSPIATVRQWIADAASALRRFLDQFFSAQSFDGAVAYLVAIHVYLAGLRFGLGRIGLQVPNS
jgi:hypothetical protein